MITYTTNPNNRCVKCNGREVITLNDGKPIESSLIKMHGVFYCKNQKECQQNIDAENTIIDFEINEKGEPRVSKITHNDETIMEVDYDGV